MTKKPQTSKDADKVVKNISWKTRQTYSVEEKSALYWRAYGEESIALCRREGIAESLYYSWSKEFGGGQASVWGHCAIC